MSEFDIAAELSYQMLKFGAEGNSFRPSALSEALLPAAGPGGKAESDSLYSWTLAV